MLFTLRKCLAASFVPGGAKACDGSTGQQQLHQPPLVFNLQHDWQEQEPLDKTSAEYRAVLPAVSKALHRILQDVASDNTSVADYSHDPAVTPCCNPQHLACRCQGNCSSSLLGRCGNVFVWAQICLFFWYHITSLKHRSAQEALKLNFVFF